MSGALLDWPCAPLKADVQPAQSPSRDSGAATESAFDDFLSLLVTREEDAAGPPKLDACCQSAVSPVDAPTPPCKEAGKRKPGGLRAARSGASRCVPPQPVSRVISNDTYLRRMHLSPEQTIALMPCLASFLRPMTTTGGQRARSNFKNVRHQVHMVNEAGQRWPVVCECVLSANRKQLHCRLGTGWARFCKDNRATVSDKIVMVRVGNGSADVVVKIDRRHMEMSIG